MVLHYLEYHLNLILQLYQLVDYLFVLLDLNNTVERANSLEIDFLKSEQKFLQSKDFNLVLAVGSSLDRSENPKFVSEGRGLLNDAYVKNIIERLRLIAENTKGKIKEWDIGCEITTMATSPLHSGTWTEAMFNQLIITRLASRVARKIDPEIKIYFGGNNLQQYSNYEKIVFGDLIKEVDGYYIDGYPGPWNMMLGSYAFPE